MWLPRKPSYLPWGSLTQPEAKTACTNLKFINGVTNKYDLISNPEWMTVAYEIENLAVNWSDNQVGSGMLNQGNSQISPSSPLAVTNPNDPYLDTGNNSS